MIQQIHDMYNQCNEDVRNENANKDSRVIPTQRDQLAGIVSKEYALEYLLPSNVAQAHKAGDIHFHDLDYSPFFPSFNCILIDIKGMFNGGFKMGAAEIETPKSISTATALCAQIIAQVASHIYGGNSINRIDEVLEPYVWASHDKYLKDFLDTSMPEDEAKALAIRFTEKETYNAFQSLEYEVNTLHTANGK